MSSEKIQKILANAGIGSRRQIETWIQEGRITVNGRKATIGDRMTYHDQVCVDGREIKLLKSKNQKSRVLLYHKPEGELCTRHDPEGRPTIFERLPLIRNSRWICVGRLDFNTSGLLLITNDGELANILMHPSSEIEREYAARIRGDVTAETLISLEKGVKLEDGMARFAQITDAGGSGSNHWYHVIVKEGRNRLVRRLWEALGFDSPLIPGWDCHGLPIELNVEKKVGKPGRKVTPAEFREACREYAWSFINIQREEFKRLGIVADWEHPYLTMDFHYEANIIRSLAKIIRNEHMQKGYKPVHWCLDCASALAEAEVEYIDKDSPSIDVRYAVCDEKAFLARFSDVKKGKGPIAVPIWTTTPWSLPGSQAVALNPLLNYVLVEVNDEQLLIAEDLLNSVLKRYNITDHKILGQIVGEKLAGILLKHPFYEKEVPIVLGEHVTVDSGTGAVHTAPAHGLEDYAMGVKYQLSLENPVGDDGCYTKATPIFAGLHVTKANEKIIETLKENQKLIHLETIRHSYPHCWRHKTALIFRATPQWFISMEYKGLRKKALEAIDRVEWIPEWGQNRIRTMMENRPDWCISRQRTWGVPLSLFIHKETGELHPGTLNLMEQVALLVEKEGIEAWYKLDPAALLGKEADVYQIS